MCEFKVIKKNDGSQISEDIVILSYTENNELLFKDILGMGASLDSALILNVNTLNQTCEIFEHPIIKNFLRLVQSINKNTLDASIIEDFQKELDEIKSQLSICKLSSMMIYQSSMI